MHLYLKPIYGTTSVMRHFFLIFFIFLLQFFLCNSYCHAAQSYNVGFRTMGVSNADTRMRFDFNIWYPTLRSGQNINFSHWILQNVAQNARPLEGKFPLLIISHASPANRFSYSYLAEYFVRQGYIVAAPSHTSDSLENMDDLFTWQQLANRVREIKATLDLLLNDKIFASNIDSSRIVFIGFGSGATAGILLCGAKPNCIQWASYCPLAGTNDVYCTNWARDRINNLCKNFPLKNILTEKRIKAFAFIAPAFGMLFTKASFAEVNVPLLLVEAGKDNFNKAEFHCQPLARILGKKASYLDLPFADAGALMSPCSSNLQLELPELCLSVSNEERLKIHSSLEQALRTFFAKYNGAGILTK